MLRRYLLWPFSLLYYAAIALRNKLYDAGVIKSYSFSMPVISVGNLSTGGTGKTPMVEYLVRLLSTGNKVAALSRGYGGKANSFHLVQSSDKAVLVGDEPLQLKMKFLDINVAIEPDRVAGIKRLELETDAKVIILDDAFQHRRVKPGFSILLTSYDSPFYDDVLLPAGNLREPVSAKNRADVIVVTKCPVDISDEEKNKVRQQLKLKQDQQVFFSFIQYGDLIPFNKGIDKSVIDENTEVVLLSGIAKPSHFEKHCSAKYKVSANLSFRDHYQYKQEDLNALKQKIDIIASPNKAIITTEKDAARLRNTSYEAFLESLPVFYLPIEMCLFDDDEKQFNSLILNYVTGNKRNQ